MSHSTVAPNVGTWNISVLSGGTRKRSMEMNIHFRLEEIVGDWAWKFGGKY